MLLEECMSPDFWDLHYVLYLIGFLLVRRITLMFVFSSYVTNGFVFGNLFLPITVWWMFPRLSLSFLNKVGFMLLMSAFPRLLLGIIGSIYLPDNRGFMIGACVVGFVIDVAAKFLRSYLREEQCD